MNVIFALLCVLSIWDYPSRQGEHDRLRRQFVAAVRAGETDTMEETCRKGVRLLPDDPTWHYNLACSLAYFANRQEEAFDELEKSIDLGWRDVEAIRKDTDLKRLKKLPRYRELLEYAERMKEKPLLLGPMATVAATGIFGEQIALGEQNLNWDFDVGCFVANMQLAKAKDGPFAGELYMNRDQGHSVLVATNFPGLTTVRFDQVGRDRGLDKLYPNVIFPYPTYANASMAFVRGPYWRSLSRALVTTETARLPAMVKMYLGNQVFVTPSNRDTAPVGTNGDVFASITPYWLTTAGRSWSDLPYLTAVLEASRALPKDTKQSLVERRLLTPTLQTLIRKSLRGVSNETAYLTSKAHPTALPPNGVDMKRLVAMAKALRPSAVPPLAAIGVKRIAPAKEPVQGEIIYGSLFAWAFVIRTDDPVRSFEIGAEGAEEFHFSQTHGEGGDVKIEPLSPSSVRVSFKPSALSPTNRIDIAVFGRNEGTLWGAPSYVSFARMDASQPYSDPVLTILTDPRTK